MGTGAKDGVRLPGGHIAGRASGTGRVGPSIIGRAGRLQEGICRL